LTSNKIRVVIADDNREFGDILYEYLNNQEDIEVVGVARDGIEAYELIVEKLPDIAILILSCLIWTVWVFWRK